MRYFCKLIAALMLPLVLAACGEAVTVPPAHVGKILTAEGFREGILPPSTFRLDFCMSLCDKLVIAEASDYAHKEEMKIFMPKDQLNLQVEVRGVYAVSNDENNANRLFDRIPAEQTGQDEVSIIPMSKVYVTYAEQIVREVVRSELTKLDINQIMSSRDQTGATLMAAVDKRLAGTPIKVMQFGLADIQPPEVIVKAKEAAAEREVAIQKAEADRQVKLKEAEVAIELAEKDQILRLKQAEVILLENQKVAASVSPNYLAYRYLEVMEAAAKNGNTIFFPVDFSNATSLQNRIFSTVPKIDEVKK